MFIKYFPLKLITKCAGFLAKINFPGWMLLPVLRFYCSYYKVDQEEMEYPLTHYKSFNEFFYRSLKPKARYINRFAAHLVSPADGVMASSGKITGEDLLQIKGSYFKLSDLIGEKHCPYFINGNYQTIYLSPADYHRVHCPFDGTLQEVLHFSGSFYPVNNWAVKNIPQLFCRNERVLYIFKSIWGYYGLLMVGALIVGSIQTTLENISIVNHQGQYNFKVPKDYKVSKGQQIAQFALGSTVLLMYCKDKILLTKKSGIVRLGSKIGELASS